jgi:hypothetical protein
MTDPRKEFTLRISEEEADKLSKFLVNERGGMKVQAALLEALDLWWAAQGQESNKRGPFEDLTKQELRVVQAALEAVRDETVSKDDCFHAKWMLLELARRYNPKRKSAKPT